MQLLNNVQTHKIFEYFEKISSIPRGSGNCKAIADYLVKFADNLKLKHYRDEFDNVIIVREASKGFENNIPVILQAHTDMVCEKDNDVEFDFFNDKLNLQIKDGYISANGTTLGADNGIGVSVILALISDETLSLPYIEAVFTSDEETGMVGASKLDASCLKGKRLINIDGDREGEFIIGCAGGNVTKCTLPIAREEFHGKYYQISVKGLKGGHSGIDINSGRANANVILANFLNYLSNKTEFRLVSINGGKKDNVIPSFSLAEIILSDFDVLYECQIDFLKNIKAEYSFSEPDLNIEISECACDCYPMDLYSTRSVIDFILISPNGIVELNKNDSSLVDTSLNLGILETRGDCVEISYCVRSGLNHNKYILNERLSKISRFYNCEYTIEGDYPAWEHSNESELISLFTDAYKKTCGTNSEVLTIHAGLECGIFASKIEGLDCISIGCDLEDIHTTRERVNINSVNNLWNMIVSVLTHLN